MRHAISLRWGKRDKKLEIASSALQDTRKRHFTIVCVSSLLRRLLSPSLLRLLSACLRCVSTMKQTYMEIYELFLMAASLVSVNRGLQSPLEEKT